MSPWGQVAGPAVTLTLPPHTCGLCRRRAGLAGLNPGLARPAMDLVQVRHGFSLPAEVSEEVWIVVMTVGHLSRWAITCIVSFDTAFSAGAGAGTSFPSQCSLFIYLR